MNRLTEKGGGSAVGRSKYTFDSRCPASPWGVTCATMHALLCPSKSEGPCARRQSCRQRMGERILSDYDANVMPENGAEQTLFIAGLPQFPLERRKTLAVIPFPCSGRIFISVVRIIPRHAIGRYYLELCHILPENPNPSSTLFNVKQAPTTRTNVIRPYRRK